MGISHINEKKPMPSNKKEFKYTMKEIVKTCRPAPMFNETLKSCVRVFKNTISIDSIKIAHRMPILMKRGILKSVVPMKRSTAMKIPTILAEITDRARKTVAISTCSLMCSGRKKSNNKKNFLNIATRYLSILSV